MSNHPGLPKTPFTIHGGCNCKAVRYEIAVPELRERPIAPYRTPGADIGDVRIPMSVICHCNNCRSATGQIPSLGLITDITTVRASLLAKDERMSAEGPLSAEQRTFTPAAEVFDSENLSIRKNTFLMQYKSSPARNRWFCGRCGTQLAYSIDAGVIPEEWGWPKMLDIWLGTVDRSDLEKDFMRPERALWCAKAVPWVAEMARNGNGGIPEHPLTKIDKVMSDDITADMAELNAIKTKVGGQEI